MTRLTDGEQGGIGNQTCQVESRGKGLGDNAVGDLVSIALDMTVMNGVNIVDRDAPAADLVDNPAVACGAGRPVT